MRVLKFGGTSIANPARIRDVHNIILEAAKIEPVVVVVSAFQGISNQLINCATVSAAGDESYLKIFEDIKQRHLDIINDLTPEKNEAIVTIIQQLLLELSEILQGIFLLKELTLGALDHIAGFGERMSANVIAYFINQHYPSEYVDARQLIFTDDKHTEATVLFDKTNEAIRNYYEKALGNSPMIPVITGFIGSTPEGRTSTLGRNSSDYSAVIVGGALDASQIEIWTDVDGVYSADPHIVPSAFVVRRLSYLEAIELSYFGAQVIHPSTLLPVIEKQIPILIKNTLNPTHPGTLIAHKNKTSKKWSAKSISIIDNITLLIWKGIGNADVSRTIERLFKALELAKVHIFLILEASPKHTIYLAIHHKSLEKAQRAIKQEFHFELQHQLFKLEEKPAQSVIAIIGDDIKKLSPEIAGRMFQALGKMKISTNAIVQGASERNISLVVDTHHRTRALNLIHQAFFAKHKCLSLIIIGAGNIGKALLQQIREQHQYLLDKKFNLSVCVIANSKKMLVNPHGIPLDNWEAALQQSTEPFVIVSFLKALSHIECSSIAVVDCTASDDIVASYPLFIQEGIHIITPNKRANVLPYAEYQSLMELFKQYRCHFLCRTNVGAGLPVLAVLQDLLDCGDSIIKIEGIFSGTLSYLFNYYNGTASFSRVLEQAQILRMTEPDPREDLSGIDVARKLLILARTMGWPMELSDIPVENLVPETLRSGAFKKEFYAAYEKYENDFKSRYEEAQAHGKVLRYVGRLENRVASAALCEVSADHPLALASHSDNIIAFTTHRYQTMPLVIRGPGAGVDVTAMGVFSDILKLLNYLPD